MKRQTSAFFNRVSVFTKDIKILSHLIAPSIILVFDPTRQYRIAGNRFTGELNAPEIEIFD